MKKSPFSKSFSSSGGGFGVFVPPLLLLLLLCLLVLGGDGGGFSPIKVAAAATKTSSSSSSSAFGGGFDGKSSRFEGRGRRRSRFLLQEEEEEEDQEQAEEVEKKLRNLIPVEGTTETEEEDAGGEVAAATATTNTKHSLLHSEVVRAHTPTAQTKDETVVEEVIAKQSEDNTDAEASEAIVAADVSEEAPATKEEVTSDDESAEDIAEEEKEKADSEYASENAEELAVETAAANAIADAVIAESDEENAAEKDGETVDEKITKSAAKKAAKFFANVKTRAKERFEKRAQEELAFYADYEDYEDDYGAAPDALTGDGFDSPADLVASGEETIEEAKEDIKDIEAEKAAIAQEKGMQMALEEIQATDLAEPTADVADPITGISPQGEQLEEQMATANGEPKPVANTPMYSLESGYDVRSALRGARSKAKKCEPKKRLTREAQCKHVRNTRACGGNLYPYLKFAYCTNAGIVIPTVIYAFGLGVSLYALALVADAFFCPALETVATILKISPEVAGATLLALGNGAPDVFAQVAAVTSGTMPDVDMAVSTALGSGLFITTVILGVVILMDRTKNALTCIHYPSDAVEIISKVHMLRPLVYAKAISTKNVESNTTNNLLQDVRKQQNFMSKILNHHCRNEFENEDMIKTSVQEYLDFLRHAGGRGKKCTNMREVEEEEEEEVEVENLEPPSLFVDAIWHAHMQLSNYCCDSVRISGSVVDHKF